MYPKNLEETLYIFGEKGTAKAAGTSDNIIEEWNFADGLDDPEHVKVIGLRRNFGQTAAIAANEAGNDLNNAYQRILQNDFTLAELDALMDEHGIPAAMPRCVMLLHMVQVQQRSA